MDRAEWRALLEHGASEAGIVLTEEHARAFEVLRDELLSWNSRVNLTSLTGDREIIVKHFIDSLLCLRGLRFEGGSPSEGSSLIDVGSGGGFPGIPLAIVIPRMRVHLLESVRKKCEFLDTVVGELNLNATVVCRRAEDAGRDVGLRESFDIVVARAVASLPVLAEYCLPFCRVGGTFISMKGPESGSEAEASVEAIDILGGCVSRIDEYELPFGMGGRSLVVVGKVRPTPDNYPRKAGIPRKRPLPARS